VDAGQLFYVAAATIFAIYFTLNTRAANHRHVTDASGQRTQHERVPALVLTAIVMLTVGTGTGLLSLAFEPWRPTLSNSSMAIAWWRLPSAVVGSAARCLLRTCAQSLSARSHGVVIMGVEPVWTASFAALWFGETMSGMQTAGCGMIFAALLIS